MTLTKRGIRHVVAICEHCHATILFPDTGLTTWPEENQVLDYLRGLEVPCCDNMPHHIFPGINKTDTVFLRP